MAIPRLVRIPPRLRRPDLERRLPTNGMFRDRTGDRLNGSKVVGLAGMLPRGRSAWLCRCDCGNLFLCQSLNLDRPTVRCGCGSRKHGLSKTRLYAIWHDIIARCYNPKHESYHRNGGMGIKVCKRWRESFEHFAEDVGPHPGRDHNLCRVNLKGPFKPDNCCWRSRNEVTPTGVPVLHIEYGGKRLGLQAWADLLGMSNQALYLRVKRCRELGADLSEAVATPARVKMPCVRARMKGSRG